MAGNVRGSDAADLAAAFDAGALVRPDPAVPNLVDVARAVATASGVGGLGLSPYADELAASLADREHLVLILADGLGLEMLEREPAAGTLREHQRGEIRAVFPSSTAVALTSLATGEWPARHAVTGWWTYVEQIGGPATILQYRRLGDECSLADLGVAPEEAFPVPSLVPQVGRRCHFLMPREIAGSVYSRYWTGGATTAGYQSLTGALNSTVEAVTGADGPTFTYVYIPYVDKEAHQAGPESVGARDAIMAIDHLVADLKTRLGDSAAVVVTADHGHLAVADRERFLIQEADGTPGLLASPPAGDTRVVEFHVRPGEHERFEGRFRANFGEHFFLLTTDEVEDLALLGPEPLAPATRQRLGDFTAISRGASVLGFHPSPASREALQQRSHHAGLTPAEMFVPLVVA